MSKIDQGQDMQTRRAEKERAAVSPLEERAAIAEEMPSQRDAKDQRGDMITARLLDMVVSLQRDFTDRLQNEGRMMQELRNGLERVERRVEEFVKAFPDGDANKHRIAHEEQMRKARNADDFWEKIKFTIVAALLLTGVIWIGAIVWKAFLLGPK